MNSKISRHYIYVTLYFSKYFHTHLIVLCNNPVRQTQSHYGLHSTWSKLSISFNPPFLPSRKTQCGCTLLGEQMGNCENLKKAFCSEQIRLMLRHTTCRRGHQISAPTLSSLNEIDGYSSLEYNLHYIISRPDRPKVLILPYVKNMKFREVM